MRLADLHSFSAAYNAADVVASPLSVLEVKHLICSTLYICPGQLHLNPLHAVVQLRPSLKYLDQADTAGKKKIVGGEEEEDAGEGGTEEGEEETAELVALQVQCPRLIVTSGVRSNKLRIPLLSVTLG